VDLLNRPPALNECPKSPIQPIVSLLSIDLFDRLPSVEKIPRMRWIPKNPCFGWFYRIGWTRAWSISFSVQNNFPNEFLRGVLLVAKKKQISFFDVVRYRVEVFWNCVNRFAGGDSKKKIMSFDGKGVKVRNWGWIGKLKDWKNLKLKKLGQHCIKCLTHREYRKSWSNLISAQPY